MLCEPSLPGAPKGPGFVAPVLGVGSLPAHRALCGMTFPRHTVQGHGWPGSLGPVPPTSLCSSLTTEQGQKGSWLGLRAGGWGRRGKVGKHPPCQKRLLMGPLNNQPNSVSVFEVGRFSIKSKLNIGRRVGTGAQGGLSSLRYCFFHWPSERAAHPNRCRPPCAWEQAGGGIEAGAHPHISHFSLRGGDGLFLGCSVGVQCFYTSNCLIFKTAHAVWLSLASWLDQRITV